MNCQQARQDILAADDLDDGILAVLNCAQHLTSCAHCQAFVAQLRNLEAATGNLRTPARVGPTPEFYTRLDEMISRSARTMDNPTFRGIPRFSELPERKEESLATLRPHFRQYRWKALRQRAVAAMIFVMVGLTVLSLVLFNGSQARAAVLLDQLVDWNVQISAATTPADRAKIYQDGLAKLGQKNLTSLPKEDQPLAELLESTAKWLITNDDPIEVAGRFIAIADKVQERHAAASDPAAAEKLDQIYRKVVARGIVANLGRVDQTHLDPLHRSRLDEVRSQAEKHLNSMVSHMQVSNQLSTAQPVIAPIKAAGAGPTSANLPVFSFAVSLPGNILHPSTSSFATTSARFSPGNARSTQAIQTVIRSPRFATVDSTVLARTIPSAIVTPPPARQPSSSSEAMAELAAPQTADTTESTTSADTVSSLTGDDGTDPATEVAVVTPLSLDSPPSDQPAIADTSDELPNHLRPHHHEMLTDDRHEPARMGGHRPSFDDTAVPLAMNDPDTSIHSLLKRFELPDADGDSEHDSAFFRHSRISREQIWTARHLSSPDAVPEPASLTLLGGVASILLLRRRVRTKNP